MTETKIYCDHCKKELDTMEDYIDIEIELHHRWFNTDLCQDCMDELYSIAENFCNK